jgi:hypothetical protein
MGSATGGTGAPGTGSGTDTMGGAGSAASDASDPLLRGMAAAGAGDPAYQQAYRDCMRRRGF